MEVGISHNRADEDIDAKARWFQSLSQEERIELFCEFTDLIFENNPGLSERVASILAAMEEGGLATATMITPEELLSKEVTIFRDRARIDVQTSTPGINFADAWQRRAEMKFRGMQLFVASKEDLIASKQAAGRPKDLEDVRLLTLDGTDPG